MIHDNLYAYFYICIYVHVHVHVYVYLYCLYVCLFGKLRPDTGNVRRDPGGGS